jgi:hypothetical protein
MNGDSFADILVGAPGVNSGAGAVYVLFGRREGFANIITNSLQSNDGFTVRGGTVSDYFGLSVAGAGMLLDIYLFYNF